MRITRETHSAVHTIVHITDDLSLGSLTDADLNDLIYHINDPVLYENTLTVPFPYTIDHAESYVSYVKAFEEKEGIQKDWVIRYQGRLIGGIGALYNFGVYSHKSEIGYWLSRDFRGTGIMTQVVGAFVDHLFKNTDLIRIEAHVFIGNMGSARVLEKNHFVLEGTGRATFMKNGKPMDSWLYALIKEG